MANVPLKSLKFPGLTDTYTVPVVDNTLAVSGAAADAAKVGELKNALTLKIAKPSSSPNGISGQLLRTNGDGTTTWVDEGLPTDAQTASAVSDWLDEHPEATTTVQDGAVGWQKLSDGVQKQIDDLYVVHSVSGDVATFIDGTDSYAISVVCHVNPSQAASENPPSPTNVRSLVGYTGITVYKSGADVSDYETISVSWQNDAGILYGGYIDVVSGDLVFEWKIYNASSLTWETTSQSANGVFRTNVDNRNMSATSNIMCDAYKTVAHSVGISSMDDYSIKGNASELLSDYIYIRDSRYTDVTAFAGAVNANFIVQLAEPVHYSTTGTPIQLRDGSNNIWSNLNETCNVSYKTIETPYVTPERYGAIGDGTADDRLALENAFNSGYPVYMPDKTYYVTDTITVTENLYLFGIGKIKFESKEAETDGIYIQADAFIDGIEIYSTRDQTTAGYEDTVLSSNITGIRYDETLCLNLTIQNAYLHDLGCGIRGADGNNTKVTLRNIKVLQTLMCVIGSSPVFHLSESTLESIATNTLYHSLYIASPDIVDHVIVGCKFSGRSFHYYNGSEEMSGTAYVFGCAIDASATDYYGNCRFYACDINAVGYGGVYIGCNVGDISTSRALTTMFKNCAIHGDQVLMPTSGAALEFDHCTFVSTDTEAYPFYITNGTLKLFNCHITYAYPSHCFRITNTSAVLYLVGCTIERPNDNDTQVIYAVPTANYIVNNIIFGADAEFPLDKNNLVIARQSVVQTVEQQIDMSQAPSGTLDSSGNVVSSSSLVVSDFIDISDAIAVYRYGSTDGTTLYRYAVYDSEYNLLEYNNNTTDYQYETVGERSNCVVYDTSATGAHYIRISTNLTYSNLQFAMLVPA